MNSPEFTVKELPCIHLATIGNLRVCCRVSRCKNDQQQKNTVNSFVGQLFNVGPSFIYSFPEN